MKLSVPVSEGENHNRFWVPAQVLISYRDAGIAFLPLILALTLTLTPTTDSPEQFHDPVSAAVQTLIPKHLLRHRLQVFR
jgi:hypothetical protein